MRESCGIFGAYSERDKVFPYLYWGMLSQNHRGHQSYGFATLDGEISLHTGLGLIPCSADGSFPKKLEGKIGVANVRYATSGASNAEALERDAMPIVLSDSVRSLAVSFNGNIVNIRNLQQRLGAPSNYSDSHAISLLMFQRLKETGSISEAAKSCMREIDGSFSVTGITNEGTLFAFKDPFGIKPLCYGCNGEVHAFSSESVGLDINGLELRHELRPGELITINDGELSSEQVTRSNGKAFCAFEFAYFARPDSKFNGKYVYLTRRDLGAALFQSHRKKASKCDVILSLPETANDAAYGFHEESGLKWDMATRRHRYISQRAFIADSESRKDLLAKKMNILSDRIKEKAIAVVDDSIVRGDTAKMNVRRFRTAGAKEVHLFITFPRIIGPCFYGIDMSTYKELIGASLNPEGIAKELGADSVNYISIDDYVKATGLCIDELCLGCVTGEYPTPKAMELSLEMRAQLKNGKDEDGRIYEQIIVENQKR